MVTKTIIIMKITICIINGILNVQHFLFKNMWKHGTRLSKNNKVIE